MKFIVTLAAAAAIALPASAAAQGLPSVPRLSAPSIDLGDADIATFIDIALQIEPILANEGLEEAAKRAAVIALIEATDIEVDRFMEMANMIADNRLLRRRVNAEVLAFLTDD